MPVKLGLRWGVQMSVCVCVCMHVHIGMHVVGMPKVCAVQWPGHLCSCILCVLCHVCSMSVEIWGV